MAIESSLGASVAQRLDTQSSQLQKALRYSGSAFFYIQLQQEPGH